MIFDFQESFQVPRDVAGPVFHAKLEFKMSGIRCANLYNKLKK